jgi:hypothetical protein
MSEDDFAAAAAEHQLRSKCQFCPDVAKLSATRRQQLYDAMFGKTLVNGKRVPYAVIVDVLTGWGIKVTQTTISKHITGTNISSGCSARIANKWENDGEE